MPGIMISGNNAKIGTDELLSIINQARLEHGEKPVRNNDFIPRVKDELEGEHYETFVVQIQTAQNQKILWYPTTRQY